MKKRAVSRTKILRAHLLMHGLNFESFGKAHGFKMRTVQTTVRRWWGKDEQPPEGTLAREIIRTLKTYCKEEKTQ